MRLEGVGDREAGGFERGIDVRLGQDIHLLERELAVHARAHRIGGLHSQALLTSLEHRHEHARGVRVGDPIVLSGRNRRHREGTNDGETDSGERLEMP